MRCGRLFINVLLHMLVEVPITVLEFWCRSQLNRAFRVKQLLELKLSYHTINYNINNTRLLTFRSSISTCTVAEEQPSSHVQNR